MIRNIFKEISKYEIVIAICTIIILPIVKNSVNKKESNISEILQWNLLKNGFIKVNEQIEDVKIYLEKRYWNN